MNFPRQICVSPRKRDKYLSESVTKTDTRDRLSKIPSKIPRAKYLLGKSGRVFILIQHSDKDWNGSDEFFFVRIAGVELQIHGGGFFTVERFFRHQIQMVPNLVRILLQLEKLVRS